jgi:tetratricopeptide (TPR) repeat protein
MNYKKGDIVRAAVRGLLFLAVIAAAMWQFKIHSQPTRVRFLVAEQALAKNNTDAARQDFEKVLRTRPSDATVYTSIMAVCKMYNRYDLLTEYGERELKSVTGLTNPEKAALLDDLVGAYVIMEAVPNQNRAIEHARRALQLDPQNLSRQNTYGYLLADNATGKGPRLDEAIKVLYGALQGMKGAPKSIEEATIMPILMPMTEDSYGWALVKQGNYPDAITILTGAIAEYPSNVEKSDVKTIYYHLAEAYRRSGKIAEARNAYRNSLFLDATYQDAIQGLALLPPEKMPTMTVRPSTVRKN